MLTQEQFHDLQTYIPESDVVKSVYAELHPEENFTDWNEAITHMIDQALNGDKEVLLNILELVYLNAHNEGMLELAVFDEEN